MNTDKLQDYFAATIALLRTDHSATSINAAFVSAMDQACPQARRKPSHTPIEMPDHPIVCLQSAADMRAIMADFWDLYSADMNEKEKHWFGVMRSVVDGGRKLSDKQVPIINSISERLSGLAIIQ